MSVSYTHLDVYKRQARRQHYEKNHKNHSSDHLHGRPLFAMTTAVMGCYQKETGSIDIPGRTPSGTSVTQPSATPAGEVIPSVDRQAELAEARAKNPDTVAWLYIPGAEVDDPVMQAEDNGYYLKLDENGEYALSLIHIWQALWEAMRRWAIS